MTVSNKLEDLIHKDVLPELRQYNDWEAKQPVTPYTSTTQVRIAIPKNGEDVDQSCFEQLWTATARDGTTLSDWRLIPTQETRLANQANQS